MARQTVNIGTSANKGNGDPLRTAFTKINNNFNELYAGNFVSPTSLESSLISAQDGVHDLGSGAKQWGDLHVKDFIHLGGKKISMSAGGALLVNNGVVQVTDMVGSVFADDSKLMMDGLTGILYGPMIGDVTGSVFADDSTIMVDAVGKLFVGNLVGDVTGTVSSIANHTTANLTENTNLYYTDVRADARITNAGSANWNAAFGWGNHASAGYLTSVPAQTFTSLTGKPTTLAGYGITDAATAAQGVLAASALQAETITLATLKTEVAASADFADYQTRIAAL
jgi:hypothetical protein